MKLQIGDTVRYLNDVGGGVVKRILSNTMVEISDDSGFEIPVLEHELILIEKATTKPLEEPAIQKQEISKQLMQEAVEIEGNDIPHFLIAFVRTPKQSNSFDLYLINDCNYHATFVVSYQKESVHELLETGMLEANTKLCVQQISYEEISQISHIQFQLLLFKSVQFQAQKPLDISYEIQAVKFYKPGVFVVNDFFEEDAYVIDVYNQDNTQIVDSSQLIDIEKLMTEKINIDKKRVRTNDSFQTSEIDIKEVDLHIHELVENELGLDASAKLDIQLQTFEKELALALQSKLEKIVFIHGVGNGVLKAKIRGLLDRDYSFLFYQDASFQKYKFGATLVYLKKLRK